MKSKKWDVLIIILVALIFTVLNCLTGNAGNLEPSGPPQPTMVTLSEISNQIELLSSPIKQIVKGIITFEDDASCETETFIPAVDPNRCIVLLSNAVVLNRDSNPADDKWISRNGACLIDLTCTQITVRIEEHAADQNVSYQIIEYK